jgi:hypothetical protein
MYSADLLMLCVLVLCSSCGKRPSVIGFLAGILFLLNPVAGLILTVFAVWILADQRPGLTFTLTAVAVFIAVLLPWTIRNYREFGRLVPLRDDLGLALYTSNNPCAQVTLEANIAVGCHQQTHPVNSLSENRMVARFGEVEYNRIRLRAALEWIVANPRAFASLTGRRFLFFWFPLERPAVAAISVFGFAGLALLLVRHRKTGLMFLCALVAGSVLYCFVEAQERYRLPVYWCMCLCAGYSGTYWRKYLWAIRKPIA